MLISLLLKLYFWEIVDGNLLRWLVLVSTA